MALPKSAGLAAFAPVLIYCALISSWTNIIIMSCSKAKKRKVIVTVLWVNIFLVNDTDGATELRDEGHSPDYRRGYEGQSAALSVPS